MIKRYYLNLNQQPNGDYEVHSEDCPFVTLMNNKQDLGYYYNCENAVAAAKKLHPYKYRINGCFYCCNSCHTS